MMVESACWRTAIRSVRRSGAATPAIGEEQDRGHDGDQEKTQTETSDSVDHATGTGFSTHLIHGSQPA
jgi:hypothetical protein